MFRIFKFTVFLLVLGLSYQPTFSAAAAAGDSVDTWAQPLRMVKSDGPNLSKDETHVRLRASLTLRETYKKLNHRDRMVEGDESTFVPEAAVLMFEPMKFDIGKLMIPKMGVPSAEALKAVLGSNSQSIYDCTQASVFANLAITDAFSPDREPNMFSKLGASQIHVEQLPQPLIDQYRQAYYGLGYFHAHKEREEETEENIKPGDFVYIDGHPEYLNRYPVLGNEMGENVYCIGYDGNDKVLYVGFGPLYKDGPKTREEIQNALADEYFDHEKDESLEAILKTVQDQKLILRELNVELILSLQRKLPVKT